MARFDKYFFLGPPEVIIQPTVGTLLLDIQSNPAFALSLRKLSSTYSGPCIRVRRASDNTEQDIGFVNNSLDTASLTSFCSGTVGFIRRVYDQSGNSRHGEQTSALYQPVIYASGNIITQNSFPAIDINGDQSRFIEVPYASGTINDQYFVVQTTKLNRLYPRGTTGFGYVAESNSNTQIFGDYGTPSLYVNNVLQNVTTRTQVQNVTGGYNLIVHKNTNLSTNWTYMRFGVFILGSNNLSFVGKLQEWVVYPFDTSANLNNIHTNINSYYNIY
jgi:hypothetical protein